MLDLVYKVVAMSSICRKAALITTTCQSECPSPHLRNTWAFTSKSKKKKKKKTTHFVHFLLSTFFFLIFLNDCSSTKRSHQTDAPLSLTANEGLNFVPQRDYELLLWGARPERNLLTRACRSTLKEVSWVSGQRIKYQTIFLLKLPKN